MLLRHRQRLPKQRSSADRFHLLTKPSVSRLKGFSRAISPPIEGRPIWRKARLRFLRLRAKRRRKRRPNTHRCVRRSEKSAWPNTSKWWTCASRASEPPAIAAQVGVSHATVSRWLSNGTFPEQPSPQRRTRLDPHLQVVAERWEAGCHNIAGVASGTGRSIPHPHLPQRLQATDSGPRH